ncbi:hypothetical protein VTN49DRAFT_6794 [Thermomyces lanuginosus]|uniref:uncharacterized protein n=1 Tax=Thermomyces lanuginosus TaxID=5541 RepID=UPI003743618E
MASSQEPVKILSLDGGGIRGLSSLLILEDIMEKIRDKNVREDEIIAIMLGRLRMTIDECIKEYRDFARQAFTQKPMQTAVSENSFVPTFSADRLRDATIKKILACTKTAVLAITKDNVDAPPTLFTTYESSTAFESCTIWEVARATSATVGFFDSIRLGRDEIEFVDAAFGYNNPCEILLQEARKQFPGHSQMRILSIRTGLGDVVTIEDSPASVIKALRDMATSSNRVARSLNDRFEGDSQYFRFNVDQGLKDITISDWEEPSRISAHTRNYLTENERTIGKFVDSLFSNASAGKDGSRPAAGCIHFAVPFERNKRFVGRESIMKELLERVPPTVDANHCQRIAIVGLGGVGKTQIALETAFRVRDKHPDRSIFWVSAIDTISFRDAYRNIGQMLEIDGIDEEEADVEKLVKKTLSNESTGSWLLIIDNADSADLFDGSTSLAHHLPSSRHGSILFTSRNREVIVQLDVPVANIFNVEGMSENEGFALLEMYLTKKQMSSRDDTANLLDFLGYLPLAIKQAAAFMAKKQISTTRYLEYCRSSDRSIAKLLRDVEDSNWYTEAQNPTATTWLISFRQIADNNPLAAEYLKFMCFLSEKAIPWSLLPGRALTLEGEAAIGLLKAYAFITEREESNIYDMHRLVRLEMLNWLDTQGELEEWTVKVIRHVKAVYPFPRHDNREKWVRYLPHAQHVLERQTMLDDTTADLFSKVGHSFSLLGQYREAETMHRQALEGREKVLGSDHPETLDSVNNLGVALKKQGQYGKAKEMLHQALEGRQKVLGPNHPHTLDVVNNLANVLEKQGQSEKAEAMYRRALEAREKVLGHYHPNTLAAARNVGIVLENQGKYRKAEAMYRRALEGREKVLGPDHSDTLISVIDVGDALLKQGQYAKAETMYRRALEGREKLLGPEDLDVLDVVNRVGVALLRQGKYEKSEAMHRRGLEGREKILGPEHRKTLDIVSNLGVALEKQGQHEKAEAMIRRALEGRERVLGPCHPDTLTSVIDLGDALLKQGQYEMAETMYRRALEGREKLLGPDHPDTFDIVNSLGIALHRQGEHEKAGKMYRRALEGREKALGTDHPSTLSSVNNLGVALKNQEKYDKAEIILRRALNGREKVLGSYHPHTLDVVINLANVLEKQGRSRKAEEMYQRALEGREKVLGPYHPNTLAAARNVGIVLENQGKYRKAEAMYRRALEGREKMLGPDHPDTLISAVDLGDALLKQEQYEKAETLYRRALEGREKLLGPGHADVLDVVSSLGIALHKQGQYEKAEAMHRRGLEGREKLLGSEHQKTLDIVDNLGIVLENLGQHEKDGEMHQRHWKDEKISWAPTIQTLFIALTTWASFFLNKWSTNGRKHCFVGHWKDERMHFGPYHPHTLASMENLALALSHQEEGTRHK